MNSMSVRVKTVNISTSTLQASKQQAIEPYFVGDSKVMLIMSSWRYLLWNCAKDKVDQSLLPEDPSTWSEPRPNVQWIRHMGDSRIVYYNRATGRLKTFNVKTRIGGGELKGKLFSDPQRPLDRLTINFAQSRRTGIVAYSIEGEQSINFKRFSLDKGIDENHTETLKFKKPFDIVHADNNVFLMGYSSDDLNYEIKYYNGISKKKIMISNKSGFCIKDYGWLQDHTLVMSYYSEAKQDIGFIFCYLSEDKLSRDGPKYELLEVGMGNMQIFELTSSLLNQIRMKKIYADQSMEADENDGMPFPGNFIVEPTFSLFSIPLYMANHGLMVYNFYFSKIKERHWAINSTTFLSLPDRQMEGAMFPGPTGRSILFLVHSEGEESFSATNLYCRHPSSTLVYTWLIDQAKLTDNEDFLGDFLDFMETDK